MIDDIHASNNKTLNQIIQYKKYSNNSCDTRDYFNIATHLIKKCYLKPLYLIRDLCKYDLEKDCMMIEYVLDKSVKIRGKGKNNFVH
jgi:hypothetical protein